MNCHALTGTRTKPTRSCFPLLFLRLCHLTVNMHLLNGMTFLFYHEINLIICMTILKMLKLLLRYVKRVDDLLQFFIV